MQIIWIFLGLDMSRNNFSKSVMIFLLLWFWTHLKHSFSKVSNLDGTMRAVLIYEYLDKPRAIALHYDRG